MKILISSVVILVCVQTVPSITSNDVYNIRVYSTIIHQTLKKWFREWNSFLPFLFCPISASYLKVCHKKDPNLNECIRESIELLRPKLSEGVPDLMIPACDPLSIPEIVIKQNSGAIHMESQYSNIVVSGLSNFTLRSVRLDPETHKFRIKLWFPSLEMTSDYHIHGKLLMMPLAGSGSSKGNFSEWLVLLVSEMNSDWYVCYFFFLSVMLV